jgi:hypothetical protein
MSLLPMADALASEKDKIDALRFIKMRNLVGAANNTKWNELICEVREWKNWQPPFRSKWVTGHISEWDSEWCYHLPFPFIGVQWLDLYFIEEIVDVRRNHSIKEFDHSESLTELLDKIGLSYEKGKTTIRIWGYLPKCFEHFDES